MGFFERGKLPPQLEDAAFKLKPGQISDPIELDDGFHVLEVVSRVPGKETTFEAAKEKIREFLLEGKSGDAFAKWVEDQRASSDIVINEKLKYLFENEQTRKYRQPALSRDLT
jgi:parvulin-like peptidyl-prolyl isomerase